MGALATFQVLGRGTWLTDTPVGGFGSFLPQDALLGTQPGPSMMKEGSPSPCPEGVWQSSLQLAGLAGHHSSPPRLCSSPFTADFDTCSPCFALLIPHGLGTEHLQSHMASFSSAFPFPSLPFSLCPLPSFPILFQPCKAHSQLTGSTTQPQAMSTALGSSS